MKPPSIPRVSEVAYESYTRETRKILFNTLNTVGSAEEFKKIVDQVRQLVFKALLCFYGIQLLRSLSLPQWVWFVVAQYHKSSV